MRKNQANFDADSKFSLIFSKYTGFLLGIFSLALVVRFYFFPFEAPLTSDALYYFWYSSDIFQIGGLPKDWSPANNGWPIFVGFFFTVLDLKDKGMTHIIIDGNKERPDFLKELFIEEEKYSYLKKIYYSKSNGFEYQVKVFEIDYKHFHRFN